MALSARAPWQSARRRTSPPACAEMRIDRLIVRSEANRAQHRFGVLDIDVVETCTPRMLWVSVGNQCENADFRSFWKRSMRFPAQFASCRPSRRPETGRAISSSQKTKRAPFASWNQYPVLGGVSVAIVCLSRSRRSDRTIAPRPPAPWHRLNNLKLLQGALMSARSCDSSDHRIEPCGSQPRAAARRSCRTNAKGVRT